MGNKLTYVFYAHILHTRRTMQIWHQQLMKMHFNSIKHRTYQTKDSSSNKNLMMRTIIDDDCFFSSLHIIKQQQQQRTFKDFSSISEHIKQHTYTHTQRILWNGRNEHTHKNLNIIYTIDSFGRSTKRKKNMLQHILFIKRTQTHIYMRKKNRKGKQNHTYYLLICIHKKHRKFHTHKKQLQTT